MSTTPMKKCDICGKRADYRVETAEWDKDDQEYTAHYDLVYLCYKHFSEK